MSKKIYRSLFDSEDVYEVEELTDNPEVSTEGIATVKKDEGEITNKQLYDLICEIRDLFKKPVTDNEPAIENEVAPLKQEIDKTAPVTTNDEDETEKVEEEEKTSKEVTDSYSKFATGVVNKDKDSVVTAQVSFQNRYNKVANS
jgi:hypothetical protein